MDELKDIASETDDGDIAENLEIKLGPYVGLKGKKASDKIKEAKNDSEAIRPELTNEDAKALDRVIFNRQFKNLADTYNKETKFTDFEQLPRGAQTAIFDLAYQYGTNFGEDKAPDFWQYITEGRWSDAIDELKDFGDDYKRRRKDEADLIEEELETLPDPENPNK